MKYEIKRHRLDRMFHVYQNGRDIHRTRDEADAHRYVYVAIIAAQLIKDTSK